jgi:NADH-quinone oxidoreductase subunit F
MERVLTRCREISDLRRLDIYEAHGGYQAVRRAFSELRPDEITEMVKSANLRGRGGAGFPTGVKWGFLPKDSAKPTYLCCNADESEPGTFKDRVIIEDDPHQLLEGIAIAAYAIGCHTAYIYIRGEFALGARRLEAAVAEARAKGYLGLNVLGTGYDLEVHVHRGAGAYICGEETGLLESLEGKRAYPRVKPPFPATYGLFGCPTIVQNVETLACVPHIVLRGPEWFKSIGPAACPGPKLYCVSGHVARPGVFELPMGTPLREIIYDHAGGIPGGRRLKAVIPGGASMPVFTADEIDVAMDFDSVQRAGSFLGSAGIIVMDETTCMVRALELLGRFFHHESCGQCTPCREGTGWVHKVVAALERGTGRAEDLDLLVQIADNMQGNTICLLADACAMPTRSIVKKFRAEFEAHVHLGRCPLAPVATGAAAGEAAETASIHADA